MNAVNDDEQWTIMAEDVEDDRLLKMNAVNDDKQWTIMAVDVDDDRLLKMTAVIDNGHQWPKMLTMIDR